MKIETLARLTRLFVLSSAVFILGTGCTDRVPLPPGTRAIHALAVTNNGEKIAAIATSNNKNASAHVWVATRSASRDVSGDASWAWQKRCFGERHRDVGLAARDGEFYVRRESPDGRVRVSTYQLSRPLEALSGVDVAPSVCDASGNVTATSPDGEQVATWVAGEREIKLEEEDNFLKSERIALPPGTVELRSLSIGNNGTLVAVARTFGSPWSHVWMIPSTVASRPVVSGVEPAEPAPSRVEGRDLAAWRPLCSGAHDDLRAERAPDGGVIVLRKVGGKTDVYRRVASAAEHRLTATGDILDVAVGADGIAIARPWSQWSVITWLQGGKSWPDRIMARGTIRGLQLRNLGDSAVPTLLWVENGTVTILPRGEKKRRVTVATGRHLTAFGNAVIFEADVGRVGSLNLETMETSLEEDAATPTVSPNGRWVAFSRPWAKRIERLDEIVPGSKRRRGERPAVEDYPKADPEAAEEIEMKTAR